MSQNQYVVFKIGANDYGMDIMNIKEITQFQPPTKLPHSPAYIEGVISIRGIVIPIINLKKRFYLQEKQFSKSSKILILSYEEQQVGFIVDEASHVMTLKDTDIHPPLELIKTSNEQFIQGIAMVNKKLIILLDLFNMFSTDEMNAITTMKVG